MAADLNGYRARVVKPYSVDYRGYHLFTSPIGAGGLTTMQMLRLIEEYDMGSLPLAERLHVMAEAMKVCWPERLKRFGDPDFVDVDVAAELSDEMTSRLKRRMKRGFGQAGGRTSGGHRADEQHHSYFHGRCGGHDGLPDADPRGSFRVAGYSAGYRAFSSATGSPVSIHDRARRTRSVRGKRHFTTCHPFLALDESYRPFATYGLPGGRTIPNNQLQLRCEPHRSGKGRQTDRGGAAPAHGRRRAARGRKAGRPAYSGNPEEKRSWDSSPCSPVSAVRVTPLWSMATMLLCNREGSDPCFQGAVASA